MPSMLTSSARCPPAVTGFARPSAGRLERWRAARRPELTTCRQAPTGWHRCSASRADSRREARSDGAFWQSRPAAAGTVIASSVSSCPAPHDIGTVARQSSSSPPSWCSCWQAVRHGPPPEEGTAAAPPVEATGSAAAVGVLREAEGSGVAASVGDQSRASTTTTGGDSSCSRTTTTPTTGTTRTATRIHRTTLLSTATGTVRKTAATQPSRSVLALESILPAQLYDRAFGDARVQREKRLKVALAALLAGASPRRSPARCSRLGAGA